MMVIAHAVVGCAIGSLTGDPVLGFVGGVVSHFVLDATPHFDPGSFMPPGKEVYTVREYLWATIDGLGCLALIWLLARQSVDPVSVVAGGFGGITPDVVLNMPLWKETTRAWPGFHWIQEHIHKGWHWTVPARDWLAGTVTQLTAIGGALWLLGL